MFIIEKLYELVERIAVCALGVGARWPGRRDDLIGYVAEVETGFWMARAGAGDDLAEEGGHDVVVFLEEDFGRII
jgi:hypothetical protein